MNQTILIMRTLGALCIVVGIISTGLYFLHMNFIFLRWIDHWGPDQAWMIRGGILLVGVFFYFLGKPSEKE